MPWVSPTPSLPRWPWPLSPNGNLNPGGSVAKEWGITCKYRSNFSITTCEIRPENGIGTYRWSSRSGAHGTQRNVLRAPRLAGRWRFQSRGEGGGPDQVRTDDLRNAIAALFQLSYEPMNPAKRCKIKVSPLKARTFSAAGTCGGVPPHPCGPAILIKDQPMA